MLNLVNAAQRERAVASQCIEDDITLLAYPLADGVLVGIGYGGGRAHEVKTETVLERRAHNFSRYGAWLPAMLKDGSWYLLRRITGPSDDHCALSADDLRIALELLC
ncbi:hypothetical protein [Collimonas sp. PA-H2]|uniref:hypothetical protein n=1 Tax=Collimonas sp. PA-H2 TaxID=1881062 RepID=UPI00117DDC37|nr:hypothetical protein [Collimonas sp. PA-H2]